MQSVSSMPASAKIYHLQGDDIKITYSTAGSPDSQDSERSMSFDSDQIHVANSYKMQSELGSVLLVSLSRRQWDPDTLLSSLDG